MRILRDLLLIILAFGLIWGIFSYFSKTTEQEDIISVEKEKELATYFNKQVDLQFKTLEDAYLDSIMDLIGQRLVNSLDSTLFKPKIQIIKSEQVNAFTAMGGHIYVFTGLLEYVDGPEELAAVLAHELAHAEKRHVIKNLIKEVGISSLFIIITGGDQVLMKEISKIAFSTSFNRKMEYEADDFALDLLLGADLNPNRLVQFFLKLKNEEKMPEALKWASTHPMLKDRIERSMKKIEKAKEDKEEVPFEIDWENFMSQLKDNQNSSQD